jgi:hypothetical protein
MLSRKQIVKTVGSSGRDFKQPGEMTSKQDGHIKLYDVALETAASYSIVSPPATFMTVKMKFIEKATA